MLLLTRGFRPLSMAQMSLGQFWIHGAMAKSVTSRLVRKPPSLGINRTGRIGRLVRRGLLQNEHPDDTVIGSHPVLRVARVNPAR